MWSVAWHGICACVGVWLVCVVLCKVGGCVINGLGKVLVRPIRKDTCQVGCYESQSVVYVRL